MAQSTKVNVPADAGDEITIRYAGADPVSYKVTDGHVTVQNEDVDAFVTAIPGASVPENKK